MSKLYVDKSKVSEVGVFAGEDIAPGTMLLQYTGELLSPEEASGPQEDYTVQIGPNQYLGPSGKEDDIVNHSCSPNTGLKKINDEFWLEAIKWILKGEEVTFDYSTTIGPDEEWLIPCNCGSSNCRGVIGKFNMLPQETQDYYKSLNVALASDW